MYQYMYSLVEVLKQCSATYIVSVFHFQFALNSNRNKLMNYRMVRDPSSGMFYIHNHTQFPAINLLISHYQTAPINTEVNTRLLHPVGDPSQQQSTEAEDAYVIMEKREISQSYCQTRL